MNRMMSLSGDEIAQLAQSGGWDWVVCGSSGKVDDRTDFFGTPVSGARLVSFVRSKPSEPHYFSITVDGGEPTDLMWADIDAAVEAALGAGPGRILLDISSLQMEALLYLLPPIVKLAPEEVWFSYMVPESYGERAEDCIVNTTEIQQPRGYVADFLTGRRSIHMITLGYDAGRAKKFLDRYDWPLKNVWAVIGDPPSDEGGVERAREANSEWLPDLEHLAPGQVIKKSAVDSFAMKNVLEDMFSAHGGFDFIPLGPRPFTLGFLMFYLELRPTDRAKIRILFDFPSPKRGRTFGIKNAYLYRWK